MKTRTDLLNHLAEKYNLNRYLEIGVQVPALNFDKIKCEYKISVDPDPKAHATICKTSDKYFETEFSINSEFPEKYHKKFDLIFIDGLHTAEQVRKDFENALKVLTHNGFIVLHDCNPDAYEKTMVPRPTKTGPWNGNVYKFAVSILSKSKNTVDIDNGCLVYRNTIHDIVPFTEECYITWADFDTHRKELLNLISWDEFSKI